LTKDKEIISTRTVSGIGKSFEFSGVIGTSYKLESGLFGSARYVQGMTDTIEEAVRNNNFQIGIGYFF
jgi:hypothetical protein